jgi:hypothetical protein
MDQQALIAQQDALRPLRIFVGALFTSLDQSLASQDSGVTSGTFGNYGYGVNGTTQTIRSTSAQAPAAQAFQITPVGLMMGAALLYFVLK